eukprot:6329675-Alexandrium_andersonii.AAC.1
MRALAPEPPHRQSKAAAKQAATARQARGALPALATPRPHAPAGGGAAALGGRIGRPPAMM